MKSALPLLPSTIHNPQSTISAKCAAGEMEWADLQILPAGGQNCIKMRSLVIIFVIALLDGCCDVRQQGSPHRLPHTDPAHLDPKTATFEEHIFALSPFKAAIPSSAEYRERMNQGYRHPKTRSSSGEYLYVPARADLALLPDAHDYRLNRKNGYFVVNWYSEHPMTTHYYRDEHGWVLADFLTTNRKSDQAPGQK